MGLSDMRRRQRRPADADHHGLGRAPGEALGEASDTNRVGLRHQGCHVMAHDRAIRI